MGKITDRLTARELSQWIKANFDLAVIRDNKYRYYGQVSTDYVFGYYIYAPNNYKYRITDVYQCDGRTCVVYIDTNDFVNNN